MARFQLLNNWQHKQKVGRWSRHDKHEHWDYLLAKTLSGWTGMHEAIANYKQYKQKRRTGECLKRERDRKNKKRERSIAVVVRATKNARSILYLYRCVITGACTLSKTPVGFSSMAAQGKMGRKVCVAKTICMYWLLTFKWLWGMLHPKMSAIEL